MRYIFLLLFAPSLFAANPVATLSKDALTVRGIARGSSVALLSVAREPDYYMARLVSRHELLVDDDRDGEVQYTAERGVAFSSIWVVVDLATGDLAMVSPEGFTPIEMHQRNPDRGKAVEAIANTLDIGRASVDLLLVRPGVGAWSARARDAQGLDSDTKKNRRIRVDLGKLKPLGDGKEKAPHALKRGDVVAILDIATMQYWTKTIE